MSCQLKPDRRASSLRLRLVGSFLLMLVVSGCLVEQEGTGPGKRQQELALGPADELELGRQGFREILADARFVKDGPGVERVRRVSQKIAKAVQIEPLRREINLHLNEYEFEWDYAVVQEDRVNAFCLPGGKVVVFSGMLRIVRNDDQLATVIAHEVAHALAHHTSERLAYQIRNRNPLLNLAFSREQELEADHIGLFLMAFAGYDPDQALEFWSRMQSAAGGRIPEILSDHPSDSRRIARMQEWVTSVKAAKEAFDAGRIAKP